MSAYFNRYIFIVIALSVGLSLALLAVFPVSLVRAAGPNCLVDAGGSGDYTSIQPALDDSGCVTITVAAGTYLENVAFLRDADVTLTGAGPGSTIIDGSGSGDVVRVSANSVVTIANITIQNGERGVNVNSTLTNLTLNNVEVVSNTRLSDDGAGIKNVGTLTLANSLVAYNVISSTNSSHSGGGIYNQRSVGGIIGGEVTIQASTILSNSAGGGSGGGIYSFNGVVTTTVSQIVGNTGGPGGGGIYINGGVLTVIETTIAGNQVAYHGGGIQSVGSEVRLTRSTISGNIAASQAGGFYNIAGPAVLLNVTVSGNSATGAAGGIYNAGSDSTVIMTNTTIASNTVSSGAGGINTSSTATTTLKHVILAYNQPTNCSGALYTISNDHNIQDTGDCAVSFSGANDLLNTDPLLAPLADYGGKTETHALNSGSPAIDAGSNADCPNRDQRTIPRPFNGDNSGGAQCDIGAYEYTPPVLGISDASLTEGNSGTTNADFIVTLFGNPTQTVTVDYDTIAGSAVAGSDYIAANDTLTFVAGGKQSVLVGVIGETVYENDETFSVGLSNTTNASILHATGLGLILNDDSQPGVSIADTAVTEGDAGTTSAVFSVTLSNASAFTVTANYETSDNTAMAGTDYITATGSITFTPGLTQDTIMVTVNGDTETETNKTFFVDLSNANGGSIVDGQGVGTILDNDGSYIYLPVVLK